MKALTNKRGACDVMSEAMSSFTYRQVEAGSIEKLGLEFSAKHGDGDSGFIPESEFDRIFDHLAAIFRKHGTFYDRFEWRPWWDTGPHFRADFTLLHDQDITIYDYRPWVVTIAGDNLKP